MAGKKQFDVDAALERAMLVFWARGYADTSLDALVAATGIGRGSLYATFGGKEALFERCLDLYAARYAARYDAATAGHPDDAVAAVAAFFEVVLDRIADPSVPDGCLVAQSSITAPVLPAASARRAQELLLAQRDRLTAILERTRLTPAEAASSALHLTGVTQSLAVLSRAGVDDAGLRAVVDVAVAGLARSLG